MSAFAIGDEIVAKWSGQGLRAGGRYRVVDSRSKQFPFATFVTYLVADDDGTTFFVANLETIARRPAARERALRISEAGALHPGNARATYAGRR